jgi:hypothetical protein
MTPKEKADELLLKMQSQRFMPLGASIQCALITVDEIINYCSDIYDRQFMEAVKKEIEKL